MCCTAYCFVSVLKLVENRKVNLIACTRIDQYAGDFVFFFIGKDSGVCFWPMPRVESIRKSNWKAREINKLIKTKGAHKHTYMCMCVWDSKMGVLQAHRISELKNWKVVHRQPTIFYTNITTVQCGGECIPRIRRNLIRLTLERLWMYVCIYVPEGKKERNQPNRIDISGKDFVFGFTSTFSLEFVMKDVSNFANVLHTYFVHQNL